MIGMQLNGITQMHRMNEHLARKVFNMVHPINAAIHDLIYMFVDSFNKCSRNGCFPGLVFLRKFGHDEKDKY